MKKLLLTTALCALPSIAFAQSVQDIGTSGSSQGVVKLESATSGGSVSVQAPATASARTITLPGAAPTNGYYVQTDGSGNWSYAAVSSSFVPRSYIAGLITSNDGTNPTTTIDVGPGQATDSTNAAVLSLASQCQVVLTTNGAGGLDTGTVAASKWYGIFIINGTSGTSCIATLETAGSAPSPTLPAGYTTYERYIGSIATDASAHPVLYTQIGRQFIKASPSLDQNVACTATGTLYTFQVPLGVIVSPYIRGENISASANPWWLSSPSQTDQAVPAVGSGFTTVPGFTDTTQNIVASEHYLATDTSGRLRLRCNSAGTNVALYSDGWTDNAGAYQ